MVGGNLVPNGDFELGLMGWRLAGEGDANLLWGTGCQGPGPDRSAAAACGPWRGPKRAADLREQGPQQALLSRPIPAQPGMRYTLSARMRSDAAGRKASISATAVGGGGAWHAAADSPSARAPSWARSGSWFPVPSRFPTIGPRPRLCVRIDPPRTGSFGWTTCG